MGLLSIISQKGLQDEHVVERGVHKTRHFVLKSRKPLLIDIRLHPTNEKYHNWSDFLTDVTLDIELRYDNCDKAVTMLSNEKTLETFLKVDTVDKCVAHLEIRIHALSSKHENLDFVLRFLARDKKTGRIIYQLLSQPIFVISKMEVLSKRDANGKKKKRPNENLVNEVRNLREAIECLKKEVHTAILHDQIPLKSENLPNKKRRMDMGSSAMAVDVKVPIAEQMAAPPPIATPNGQNLQSQFQNLQSAGVVPPNVASFSPPTNMTGAFTAFINEFNRIPNNQKISELAMFLNNADINTRTAVAEFARVTIMLLQCNQLNQLAQQTPVTPQSQESLSATLASAPLTMVVEPDDFLLNCLSSPQL